MIRRPPRSTQSRSSAASDVYKRQNELGVAEPVIQQQGPDRIVVQLPGVQDTAKAKDIPVSYTHLRAHETPEHLVCRLLLEKKKKILPSLLDILTN